ncbi:hypothetical protein TRAPUB_5473 [Trametes pubescens]|uniref:Fungal-type protein kinase domain-containing protein n=1 Tax=Trametes pubescens TaxID=154538 RepID=A0A1M2V890_TRAPU|nr:hypothetical protein TRAPUB_5473 [Trametes pubescens]
MMVSQPSTVPATASAIADHANVALPVKPDPTAEHAESAQLPKQAHRVRAVHARNQDTISGTEELIASIACAIDAHREIYEHGPAKELHGDINPNSIVIFDHPPGPSSGKAHNKEEGLRVEKEGDEDDAPWDSPYGPSAGAMVYWEPPISFATLRLVGNPDKPQPPPAWKRERYRYVHVMPPWDAGWR